MLKKGRPAKKVASKIPYLGTIGAPKLREDVSWMAPAETPKVNVADPWVHRSAGMKCKTCIRFAPKVRENIREGEFYDIGRCRRHAPTMDGFPIVFVNDWCCDHRLDENKL